MLKTGKPISEGQSFRRRLLSEYIAEYTLENYVSYYDLKKLVKEAEHLRLEGEARKKECIEQALKSNETTAFSPDSSVKHSPMVEGLPSLPCNRQAGDEVTAMKVGVVPQCKKDSSTPINSGRLSPFGVNYTKEILKNDPVFVSLRVKRETVQERFFQELEKSYRKVKSFLIGLEKKIMLQMVELHKLTEVTLREATPPDYIPRIYLQLECVLKYRELNLLAFRKIMQKFLQRCACDSLELQRRIYEIDELISKSNTTLPTLDLRGVALELIGVYGTVYRHGYEDAVRKLSEFVSRAGVVAPRILASRDTFFASGLPHVEPAGGFAIRTLAGTRSRDTEKMITEVLHCARFPDPPCARFPNGEIQVRLPGSVRGDDVFVVQSLAGEAAVGREGDDDGGTNGGGGSPASAAMELLLMLHAAELAAAAQRTAVIPYLGATRNVASVAALAEMIEAAGCEHVITVDLGCAPVEGMFAIPLENVSPTYEFVRYLTHELRREGHDFRRLAVVAAAGEHVGRAKDFADAWTSYAGIPGAPVDVCAAVRSTAGGRLPPSSPPAAAASRGSSATSSAASAGRPDGVGGGKPLRDPETPPPPGGPGHTGATRRMEKVLRRQARGRPAIVRREMGNPTDGLHLVGEVRGRLCIVLETEINEGVETANLARCLHEHGAERILIVATHAVLAGDYRARLLSAPIERIIVTDTIIQDDILRDPQLAEKFRVLPIAPLLARAIEKIHSENNLATLFEK